MGQSIGHRAPEARECVPAVNSDIQRLNFEDITPT